MELLNIQWIFTGLFSQKNIFTPGSDKITDTNTRTFRFMGASNHEVMDAINYLNQTGQQEYAKEMKECWQAFQEFSFRHFGEMQA